MAADVTAGASSKKGHGDAAALEQGVAKTRTWMLMIGATSGMIEDGA